MKDARKQVANSMFKSASTLQFINTQLNLTYLNEYRKYIKFLNKKHIIKCL